MKKIVLLFVLYCLTMQSQTLTQIMTTGSMSYLQTSGWLNFQKVGTTYTKKFYTVDSTKFQIMQSETSLVPQYTYTFTAAETLAGGQIYSLGVDLTGDNIPEYYVIAYNGTSTVYYESFKIIDITNNKVIFEKKDPNYFYTYPTLADINGDGNLEMYYAKYPYPALTTYVYEVFSTGIAGVSASEKPVSLSLKQNYPNPFNPSTAIEYSLSAGTHVSIGIYDMKGALVRTLVNADKGAGTYTEMWDGRNAQGNILPSGVYFYQMQGASNLQTKKMILLR